MKYFLSVLMLVSFSVMVYSQQITPAGPVAICAGSSVTLSVTGGSPTSYQWQSGTTIVGTANTYTATAEGNYTVVLNGGGVGDTLGPVVVTLNPLPAVPAFTFNPNNQCANLPVNFIVSAPVSGVTYTWDFGDGTTGTGANIAHTFSSAIGNSNSTFNVKLIATSTANCVSSASSQIVSIQQKPNAILSDLNGFRFCGNVGPATVNVFDQSVPSLNSNYTISWGDDSPDYSSSAAPNNLPHIYTTGIYNLVYTVKGTNGCTGTANYTVYNITNPRIGAGIPANTQGCGPVEVCFPINNFQDNHPSTIYKVDFGDGSPVQSYTHPPPESVCHSYTATSCGAKGNAFTFKILAINGCDTSNGQFSPIRVYTKPSADFSINPNPGCVNSPITFQNTTIEGSNNSCSKTTVYTWNFGDGTAPTTVFSNATQIHPYSAPGNYPVTLTAQNSCGATSITKTICITTPPTPSFNLNNTTGCIPLTVTATNTTTSPNSCTPPTYLWSVTYAAAFCGTASSWSFTSGSTNTSTSPGFIFNNPGTYTITLAVTNECGTFPISQTVTVKQPPTVTINPFTFPCGPVTISPAATVTACSPNPPTYAWSFTDGTPATSTAANPGAVSFTTVGVHAITLIVTNECGPSTATSSVTVSAAPDVIVPANKIYCGGETAAAINFTSTVGTPTYNWTNSNPSIGLPASGIGSIPAFTATNNGTTPIVATIIVNPVVSTNCSGIPASFTITVNPRPLPPVAATPVIYCLNATAVPLTATAAASNTVTWYNNSALTGGSPTAPIPATTTQGSTLYYVTQSNSFGCASPATIITVTVNPSILGNVIASSQNICANTMPATLASSGIVSGGSGIFIYQWQSSIDGGITWTNISGAAITSFTPPALTITTSYRRVINSGPCSDTSNIATITVQGALVNYGIGANQIICAGVVPAQLTGQVPTGGGGGYTYVWELSTDNINWSATGGTASDYQPAALSQTTYFRRRVTASQCAAVSDIVTITVNPTPTGTITPTSPAVCQYNAGSVVFNATTGTALFTVEVTVHRPGGIPDSTITQTINTNGPQTINVIAAGSPAGSYTIALTKVTDKNCQNAGAISSTTIIVNPTPVIGVSTPPIICNGATATLTASGATTYLWSPATGLSNATGSSVTASPAVTTTYNVTGTSNNCSAANTILVTVTPGTTIANAGASQIVCNSSSTALTGNIAVTGTGAWSQLSGPIATITNAAINNTTVTGLTTGQRYIFTWTITGIAPCPPTSANDTIDVLSPIISTIGKDTIICNGATVTLVEQQLSGGSTTGLAAQYSYQWQRAAPGQSNWQVIVGATQATLTQTPVTSTCYQRIVKSNGACTTPGNTVCITVNPNISNNIISAAQEVCVNILPAILTGAAPSGGDGNYLYQWQVSTDNTTWSDVVNTINYQPAIYTTAGIHYFRRNASSGNCTSASNTISVTVRPDAKAIFTANPTISCAAFNLANAITVTPLPGSNGTYYWYADDALFGSNTTGIFPGYTINATGDTVIIKLVTTSQYGCKADSIAQQFITVITAQAKFAKDAGSGCSPLPVKFTNTSSLINNINFNWDFGNGATSTLAQPGTVIFAASPGNRDTTYQVTLKAYNGCDTTIWRDSVKIRANPKARFGVDTTFGCSPFTVQVNNTSLGGPSTYYWDFGNGHLDTTTTTGTINYTYNSGPLVDTFTIQLIAVNECKRDTQRINVRVAPNDIKANININSTDLFGCAPHIIAINNSSIGATTFTWNFGDGSPNVVTKANQSTVPHAYTDTGTFIIQVHITNGCSDTTVYRQVTVYAKPTAGFTTNKAIYCQGDTVKVNNTSINATNYQWFWGDGTAGTGVSPTHVYAVSGNYTVYLRAEKTNSSGLVCYDTLVRQVTILGKPIVTVQSNANGLNCAPFTLLATAPGIINERTIWYFYDSTVTPNIITATGASAQYIFKKPGTFYVKLLAQNIAGCSDSITIPFTVQGMPVAAFTPGDIAICTRDTTISYINTTTYNGNGPIRYNWLVDNVSLSANGNFTHQYTVSPLAVLPRIFTTWLIVSNSVGCSDTAKAVLQMNPSVRAQFSISNSNVCVPFISGITNNSQFATAFKWLLNGVLVSTDALPQIVIGQAATLYTLTLVADNIYGCKPDTFSINFTSRIKPVAGFTVNDTLGCTGILNVATHNTTTSANTYTWNWGDNMPGSNFINPTHLYNNLGQYQINLVASDGVCRDTASQLVKIGNKPTAGFTVNTTLTCDTARVQFINQTANADNYLWDFGDGTFSTAVNPKKSYPPSAIPYTIKLVAISAGGCKDSTVKANLVLAKVPPASDFFISPTPVITVPNYTFSFNNLTLDNPNYEYQWSLGDGSSADSRDVLGHKYADTGNYPIRLIVLDKITGCIDTTIKIARIDGFPGWMYIPNAICPNCLQENLRTFLPKAVGLKQYHLQIFTTWGELVFESTSLDSKGSPNQPWDARYKGGIVMQDAYVWKIQAKFANGSEWLGMIYPGEAKYKKAGSITVVK